MSAFGGKADIVRRRCDVRFWPKADIARPKGCPLASRSESDNRSASGLRTAVLATITWLAR